MRVYIGSIDGKSPFVYTSVFWVWRNLKPVYLNRNTFSVYVLEKGRFLRNKKLFWVALGYEHAVGHVIKSYYSGGRFSRHYYVPNACSYSIQKLMFYFLDLYKYLLITSVGFHKSWEAGRSNDLLTWWVLRFKFHHSFEQMNNA